MNRFFVLILLFSAQSMAQSIALDKLSKTNCNVSFIEFRDAKYSNALKLVKKLTSLSIEPNKKLGAAEFDLKLQNIDCEQLLKIIQNQATR